MCRGTRRGTEFEVSWAVAFIGAKPLFSCTRLQAPHRTRKKYGRGGFEPGVTAKMGIETRERDARGVGSLDIGTCA